MQTVMNISPKELCFILSAPESELTPFQLAMKRALEKANTAEELKVISERSCLQDQAGVIAINRHGKGRMM